MPRRKKSDMLWAKAFELQEHFNDVSCELANMLDNGNAIHPESSIAIKLVEAYDRFMYATHAAIHADGDCDCGD